MNKTLALAIICSFFIFSACSKDSSGTTGGGTTTVDCSTVTNKSFSADVNPIVQATCNTSGCHAAGSFNGPGAITNYNEVFANRSIIRIVIASGRMPQGGSLTTSQKNSILCWIDSGAANN